MSFLSRSLLLACFALVGCAADSTEVTPTDPGMDLVHPPPRPKVSSTGSTRWFVVDAYRLGLTEKSGATSTQAWTRYGFDLDGRWTHREDSMANRGSCLRRGGAPQSVLSDGDGGVDNNFGQHFMSIVKSLMPDAEKLTNERVAAGGYTLALRVDDLGDGPDDAYAPGALYLVGHRDAPRFAPDEKWPVAGTSPEPIAVFPAGYVSGRNWVSGDLGAELPIVALPFLGDALVAPLYGGVLTIELSTGEGMMAGAVRTTEFLEAMRPSLMRRGICPGNATYAAYVQTVSNSSDMLATLPLASDPTRTCDAVSLGIGFTVKPIAGLEGTTGTPEPPTPECKPD